jgi:hypothetical protein
MFAIISVMVRNIPWDECGMEISPESIPFLSHMGDLDGVGIFVSSYLLRLLDNRFNRREDAELFENTVMRMAGLKPMPYAKLIEQNGLYAVREGLVLEN